MAWIKGILEGLRSAKATKTAKTAKEVKAVVNAPKIATSKNIVRTTRVASEQTKTISTLRRAGGEVAGRIPKALSKRSIVAGATAGFSAGFAGGALTMAMLSSSASSASASPTQTDDKRIKDQTEDKQIKDQITDQQITDQTAGLLSRANELSSGILSPLEGIPILGGVVKEAKEEGFSFPLLIALIASGGLVAYGVYRFVKKKKKAKAQKVNK